MSKAATIDWFSDARREDVPGKLKIIERVRAGVPFTEVTHLSSRIGMSQDETAVVLHIPSRTFARRKETADRLAPRESERFVRFARIFSIANDVLGSMQSVKIWMKHENRALGGVTPMSLLDTDIGAQAVEDVLGRIEHGIFS